MDVTAPSELETGLEALAQRLAAARAAIGRGDRVELFALDSQMNGLCMLLVAEKPESRRFLPRLEALMDTLNALEAELQTQFEAP